MRIVGGTWRGRRLFEPRGADVTRPTTDRVREACASMLEAARDEGIAGASVLDAFGGSGAMGLELLSRGAARAAFFDCDRAAAALIRRNIEHLGAGGAARVQAADVFARARCGLLPGAPYDIVVLDPPYAFAAERLEALLADLAGRGALAAGCLVLAEHAAEASGPRPAGFSVLREKRYGITAVDLLGYDGVPDGPARG